MGKESQIPIDTGTWASIKATPLTPILEDNEHETENWDDNLFQSTNKSEDENIEPLLRCS